MASHTPDFFLIPYKKSKAIGNSCFINQQIKNLNIMNFDDLVAKKDINMSFYRKNLRDEDLDVVNEVLRKSKVLEELDLYCNQLTLADGKFTDALANTTTLKHLNLGYNHIGAEGAKRLADALKVNKSLKILILIGNKIGDEGVKHIADALMENETLEIISLSDNKIGDEGANSLAKCFMVNSINEVYLEYNNISDNGARKLIEALKWNYGINTIDIELNPISEHVKAEMTKLLKDPERKVPHAQMEHFRKEIATLKTELATEKRRIEMMATAIRSPLEQILNVIDPVDLTGDESGPSNKRARADGTVRSNLALLHQINQEHTHTLVQVKQEKNTAEANLKSVQDKKEALVIDLKEAREDAEDANETVQQQLLATDIWQRRFDELAALVAGQVDGASVLEIRSRTLASGS